MLDIAPKLLGIKFLILSLNLFKAVMILFLYHLCLALKSA